jgi:hypothetical protein
VKSEAGESVRKIRTVRELADLMRIVPSSRSIPIETLRRELVDARLHEAATYLGLLRRRRKSNPRLEDQTALLELAKDRVAFANALGIWLTRAGRISLTTKGQLLKRELEHDKPSSETALLQLILESQYKSYRKFLKNMAGNRGSVTIAGESLNRTKSARNFVRKSGFAMDVASFHTIKDLFYDFGILNWRIFKRKETLYLTRDLYKYASIMLVKEAILEMKGELSRAEVSPMEYSNSIEAAFHSLGYEKDVYHEILLVRDEVCHKLRISDQSFAEMTLDFYRRMSEDSKIVLGVGPLVERPPVGYSKKLSTLPELKGEEQLTKIMVRSFGI